MKKKIVSSLVLSGAMAVMAPQLWAQAGGTSGSSGVGQSGTQRQGGSSIGQQQRGSSSELQGERASGRAGTGAQSQVQSQRQQGMQGQGMAGQQLSREKVKEIQEALKEKGNDPGQADGIMGPRTQQALRQFQKQQNLQVTGRVDQETAQALGVDLEGAAGAGASSSGMGTSSGRSGSGAGLGSSGTRGGTAGYPESTTPKKGSTAGKQESGEGNPQ